MKIYNLKIKIIFFLLLFFSVFGLTQSSQAAEYYVATNGNDANVGSINAPFKTIQKAANIVNPGDTVIVADGTYVWTSGDDWIVNITRSGSIGNVITFQAENDQGAIIDGNETYDGFLLTNVSYIKIQGFEIKNTKMHGIYLSTSTNNINIYKNIIHDSGHRYIPCNWTESSYGHTGIYAVATADTITVDSNLFYNIGRLPGGYCGSGPTYPTCYNLSYPCPDSAWFDYNHDHALYMNGDNHIIKNNIFYDNLAGWDIEMSAWTSESLSGWRIYNNTFAGENPQRDGHILMQGINSDIIIQNNIFYDPNNYAIIGNGANDDSSVIIRNNLVYGAVMTDSIDCSYWTCSNNQNNIDPKFIDLASHNYHLCYDSPAIGKGLDTGAPTIDYEGNIRPQGTGFDIGAYEYVYSDTTPPAAPMGLTVQ